MTVCLRQANLKDLKNIHSLAQESGVGITTLSKDEKVLKERLEQAISSFQKEEESPAYFLFVLEETETKKIIGCSGIKSETGIKNPFYSYRLSKYTRLSHALSIRHEDEILILTNDNQNKSELCTLYLEKASRKLGNALLLSKARFLFMANYPERFKPAVIAEIRGVSDALGISPFWNALGSKFFEMSFSEADKESLKNHHIIQDLMPSLPIYTSLLPFAAQNVINSPHQEARGALTILQSEGFEYNGTIDIFDGGPTVEAPFSKIYSITNSRIFTLKEISEKLTSKNSYLISNIKGDFLATIGNLQIEKDMVKMNEETANALSLKPGDGLRAISLFPKEKTK